MFNASDANADDLLSIFETDEDLYGSDPMKMSSFIWSFSLESRISPENQKMWKTVKDHSEIAAIFGSVSSIACFLHTAANAGAFVADFSHLNQDVIDGLKNGRYHIGESKEVPGNYRPAIFDEKERIVKWLTMKKAVKPTELLAVVSTLAIQYMLTQISSKLNRIENDVQYLIAFERRDKLCDNLLKARDYIRQASNEIQNRDAKIFDANKALTDGIVSLYGDLDDLFDRLFSLHCKLKKMKEANNLISYICQDFVLLQKHIVLQEFLYSYQNDMPNAIDVLSEFKFHLQEWSKRRTDLQCSPFELLHRYYRYKNNIDFWLEFPPRAINSINALENAMCASFTEIYIIVPSEDARTAKQESHLLKTPDRCKQCGKLLINEKNYCLRCHAERIAEGLKDVGYIVLRSLPYVAGAVISNVDVTKYAKKK